MKKIRKTTEDIVRENLDNKSYEYLTQVLEFVATKCELTKWNTEETKKAFEYYNSIFPNKQTGLWCSSCRATVNKGLKHLLTMIPEHIYTLGPSDDLEEQIGETYKLLSINKLRELMGL